MLSPTVTPLAKRTVPNLISRGSILNPTEFAFENQAVLNPACIEKDGVVHMYYRAVRQGNHSTIGYCQLIGDLVHYRSVEPILFPEHEYESHGLEDPRIVFCEGLYYMLYTAYDGRNARIAYAWSEDLVSWTKGGVISPAMLYSEVAELCKPHTTSGVYDFYRNNYNSQDLADLLLYDKDALLFPRKINGKFVLVHRIFPGIQLIHFSNFSDLTSEYWRENIVSLERHTILQPKFWFESRHIGGGCPPIETEEGWLFIYHGVENSPKGRVYHAAVALLDLEDPTIVKGQLDYPLFSPQEAWELKGDVDNVVFPSGAVCTGTTLHIYYGAADLCIGMKSVEIADLLAALKTSS